MALRLLTLIVLVFIGARFDHQDAFAGVAGDVLAHSHGVATVDTDIPVDHHRSLADEQGLSGGFHCGSSILFVIPCGPVRNGGALTNYMVTPSNSWATRQAALEPPPPRV